MRDEDRPAAWKLRLIAKTLGIPVERFFTDPTTVPEFVGHAECLRLWSMIGTDDGRERALECLRRIVAEERR